MWHDAILDDSELWYTADEPPPDLIDDSSSDDDGDNDQSSEMHDQCDEDFVQEIRQLPGPTNHRRRLWKKTRVLAAVPPESTCKVNRPMQGNWWRAPMVLMPLLVLMASSGALDGKVLGDKSELDAIELFSGCQSASNAFRTRGLNTASFDMNLEKDSLLWNFASGPGFVKALHLFIRLRPFGLSVGGPPCSSFVWMNRSTSKRALWKPEGDLNRAYIRDANLIVVRYCLLMALASALGIHWLIEQPGSSTMAWLPRFQDMLQHQEVYFTRTWLGAFRGGSTEKPTKLWGSKSWVRDLAKEIGPSQFSDKPILATRDEFGGVTGTKALKESQSWPVGFGESICSLHLDARKLDVSLPQWVDYTNNDQWDDAKLQDCMDFLRGVVKPTSEAWPEIPKRRRLS